MCLQQCWPSGLSVPNPEANELTIRILAAVAEYAAQE